MCRESGSKRGLVGEETRTPLTHPQGPLSLIVPRTQKVEDKCRAGGRRRPMEAAQVFFFCGLVTLNVPFLEELSRQRIWGRLRHEPSPSPLP